MAGKYVDGAQFGKPGLPIPPVEMKPGKVLPEKAMRPVSRRTEVLEKLRSRCSNGFCLSYWPAMKMLYLSLARSPHPTDALTVDWSPLGPWALRVGML